MSAPSTQPIARPRPPAQLRRSLNGANDRKNSDSQSPPPPYQVGPDILAPLHKRNLSVCSVSSTVDASVALTAQMLGLDLDAQAKQEQDRELDEEYIREKSRDELEKLLLKAEAVIRARERELSVAAAVGKQLLETNLSLRERHASLVTKTSPFLQAGGPAMGGQAGDRVLSPPMSPIASPALLHPSTPTPIFQRHSRRLSTSPAQLAVLSSQNEDLIQALGKLQDETSAADLDGKQRLRKLEKEIAGLRAELEQSHLKNGELEQRINSVQNDHERELELKKQERESKVHELRRSTSKAEAPPQTFANFAPTSNSPAKPNFSKPERSKDDDDSTPTRPALLPFPSSESQITVTSTRSPNPGEPSAELMILGQLLSKIEELESTNREILERHRENDSKLRTATNQSDALQKVYENLEDEVEDYADDEAGTFSADHSPLLESPPLGNGSPLFAFRGSFKGRGLGFLYPPSSQRVRSLKDRGSPVSSLRGKSAENLSEPLRKPLNASLFGDGPVADDSDHLDVNLDSELDDGAPTASRISALKSRYSKRRMRPKASLDAQMLSVTTSNAGLTPPLQRLRAHSSHQGFVNLTTSPPVVKQTLWSELNNDLGEDWQDEASKDDLSRNFENGGAEQDLNEDTITINPAAATKSERTIAEENRAVAAIRYALDPRNAGRPLDDGEHILPVGSLEGSPGESFFLLTHAVEARPNKWIVTAPKHRGLIQDSVSRMKHMALPPSMSLGAEAGEDPWETRYPEDSDTDVDAAGQVIRRGDRSVATRASNTDLHGGYASDVSVSQRRMAALWRLNNTANARSTGSMRRRRVGERFDEDEDTFNDDQDASREVARRGREMEIEGWGRTVMEIWIILQAAIILLVFVYSMARRGPRAILDAAEVKRRPR